VSRHPASSLCTPALCLLLAPLTLSAADTRGATTELAQVLDALMSWLPGEYSNAAQVAIEAVEGAPPSGPHESQFRIFARIDAPQLGEHVIYTQIRIGGSDGPLFSGQQVVFVVSIDRERRAVKVSGRRIKDPEQFIDAHEHPQLWPKLAPDPDFGGNCDLLWRRHGKQLVARTADATHDDSCTMVSRRSGTRLRWEAEWVLNPEELWIHDNGYRDTGELFTGRADGAHLRFTKTREYECLLGYRPAVGEPQFVNGQHMHDGGDTFVYQLKDSPPRQVYYQLLRGRLPDVPDGNGAEVLRLSLYEGTPDGDEPHQLLGYGWANATSDRAALGTRQYSGRCKLFDPSMPPPKAQ